MPKITPKQAFDAIKVLYPDSIGIAKTSDPKTVQLLPPNETQAYARMKFSADVEIDWGTQTQYPETVYRDATPQDAINGVQAEFSSCPDFRDPTPGILTGWVTDHDYTWWYRTSKDGGRADACRYCRIPVPAPEPAPPEGFRLITEDDKKTYSTYTTRYVDIITDSGEILKKCYHATSLNTWRQFGFENVGNPKYIRQHQV